MIMKLMSYFSERFIYYMGFKLETPTWYNIRFTAGRIEVEPLPCHSNARARPINATSLDEFFIYPIILTDG
jgi:hypothetical protein